MASSSASLLETREEQCKWSTIVPNTAREDRGDIRRCFDPTVHPQLGVSGCRTLYEAIRRGAALNPLGPCLGFRAVSTSGLATPYIYSSYTECVARIDALAAGLDTLGLVPYNSDHMKVLGLYLRNCMEWILAEYAAYCVGAATVPIYDTLGPDSVEFILIQTETKTVVCTRAELPKLCQVKQAKPLSAFQAVLLADGVTPEAALMAQEVGLQLMSLAKVEAVGAHRISTQGHSHQPPSPDDVATFCYTSGTTGNPKGAMMTHQNFISAVAGMHGIAPQLEVKTYDRHLSYMPLAHIFERTIMTQLFLSGACVAFFRGDPTLLVEDWQACRPTIMIVVPRVLNKLYDKIHAGVAAAGGIKKKLFDSAVAAKAEGLKQGRMKHFLYDRLIFNKIKHGLGMDHLRVMISGSAPLSENVMIFFRCMLGIPVLEGYGQTEGNAAATLSHPDDVSTAGHVGGPTGVVEIVLMDVPEMGYSHQDTDHRGMHCEGRGEICIRGPNVFKGYYKEEEKTKEAIDEEGWLHSGDIGLWRPDGALQIIDRKKNIFKLAQGEYVAPEKIENILTRSPLISQCFVYGDSLQSSLVGIVVPDEEQVRLWIRGIDATMSRASLEELCRLEELREAIMTDIDKLSSENGLHGFEYVKAVLLETQPFTVENNLLTPTFKLKRQQMRDQYLQEIDRLYSSLVSPARSRL